MKLIIFTHGNVAKEMYYASGMIMGEHNFLSYICLLPQDSIQDKRQLLLSQLSEQENLILVDFVGGSPFNETFKLLTKNENIHLITGVNMPMCLSAIECIEEGKINIEQILDNSKESIKYIAKSNYQQLLEGH